MVYIKRDDNINHPLYYYFKPEDEFELEQNRYSSSIKKID